MRSRTTLRWTGAIWFLPVVFALGVFVGGSNLGFRTAYPVADLAAASLELILVGPLLAGFVALKFAHFGDFVDGLRPRRSGLLAVLVAGWPLLVGGPVAAVLALFSAARVLPNETNSWAIVTVVFLTMCGCACLGLAAVRALPAVLAIPLAAGGSYAWLALPGSGTNVLIRNINSSFVGCCTPEQVPAEAMLLGSLALVGTIVLGALSPLIPRLWARQGRVVSAAWLAIVVGSAYAIGVGAAKRTDELNLLAVQPRTSDLTCQESGEVEVCVWPENQGQVENSVQVLGELNAGVVRLGLPPATIATERLSENEEAIKFSATHYLTPSDLAWSLAYGYAQRALGCPADGQPTESAIALVAIAAGLTNTDLTVRVAQQSLREAEAVFARPASARAWFDEASTPSPARCPDSS